MLLRLIFITAALAATFLLWQQSHTPTPTEPTASSAGGIGGILKDAQGAADSLERGYHE